MGNAVIYRIENKLDEVIMTLGQAKDAVSRYSISVLIQEEEGKSRINDFDCDH